MVRKFNVDDPISKLTGFTVGDFWAWAYSDILSNRNRAIFAEFLVGVALGITNEPRMEWDGYDLLYNSKRIEVKAAGYLQSWKQTQLSKITFDIARKNAWDAATNTFLDNVQRIADCYIFCLYAETNPMQVDVLNIDAWEFYMVPTTEINARCGEQKSLGLNRLRQFSTAVPYESLKPGIDDLLFGDVLARS